MKCASWKYASSKYKISVLVEYTEVLSSEQLQVIAPKSIFGADKRIS